IEATHSDAGFGCFYQERTGRMELVATHGVSERFVSTLTPLLDQPTILRQVIEGGEGILRSDIRNDATFSQLASGDEDFRSAIVVPLVFEDLVLGALAILSRKPNRFQRPDFELATAAVAQISLAVHQSQYYASEKQHAYSLSLLYRMTQALASTSSLEEIGVR